MQLVYALCLGVNFSCDNIYSPSVTLPSFRTLEYSYDGGPLSNVAFSIRIDSLGKAVLSKGRWEFRQYFQAMLSPSDLDSLFRIVREIQNRKLQSKYFEPEDDIDSYSVWITTMDSSIIKIYVNSDNVPSPLYSMKKIIYTIQKSLKLQSVKSQITFPSAKEMYPIHLQFKPLSR